MAPISKDDRIAEVKRNYEALVQILPTILAEHHGQFALMRDEKVIECFDTAGDANRAGMKLFSDEKFSIQQITNTPIDLGFFSHAVPERIV
jgi:hypothetical protein